MSQRYKLRAAVDRINVHCLIKPPPKGTPAADMMMILEDWPKREQEVERLRADLAAAVGERDALASRLTFVPPPGPPAFRPEECPHGHRLHWVTNRLALCPASDDLSCFWELGPGDKLQTVLNPAARGFAYAIKAAYRPAAGEAKGGG